MAVVDVDFVSLQEDSQPKLFWSEGRQPLGAVLYSSNEPGELSQWFCHDDSTINIGICIIIIIIIIIIIKPQLAIARLRLHASMKSIWLSVCFSVCLSPNCKKNAIFSKTKQYRAVVSIDDL